MTELNRDLAIAQAIALIKSYSFDTNGRTAEEFVEHWLNGYHASWIRLAAIEALYLGRYKAVSIEQIMGVWVRIGSPNIHFGGDFERLICRKLPRHLVISDFSEDKTIQSNYSSNPPRKTVELFNQAASNSHHNQTILETPTHSVAESTEKKNFLSTEQSNQTTGEKPSQNSHDSQTITHFPPLPDSSPFFRKLKSLAHKKSMNKS